ncbi:hypothetical protein GGR22_003386 [Flavobacterium gossypii]|jgi:hypothetical protein|uniref:DUF4252 domain-containing protein n=1 Tax=Flavobacterium gossypii TaxID=1646119 RepID=A0ABR6DUR7_9FLAO|nr:MULTISPECIES: DUF4252 domain-containing protein [Flavobacterium]MBA9075203.1 hypothetical protein [Flavobacterium gossypii]WDO14658.1 DUF4252 domain-containing protein [Flavobacterium sp. WW92]
MTKFIVTLALALVPALFFGQSAFDKFDGQDDITSVVVNKKAFEMLGEIKTDVKEKEVAKYMKMADKIDNFKMFSTSSIKKAAEMKTAFDAYRKKESLEELVRVNDKGKNVQIYMKSGNSSSKVKELLMFIEGGDRKGDETVLISLTGDIDLSNLDGLSK